ncbi:MAG: hypothetical protein KDA84_08840 [Planctomycetaceae bacterium]|nr:hypothetical protein [Planctomycetaceae bacterium]
MTKNRADNKKSPGLLRRVLRAGFGILLGLVCWILIRESLVKRSIAEVRQVVSKQGGRMGSIHIGLASEYAISFQDKQFTSAELSELSVLEKLAKWKTVHVVVYLIDTNITDQDIRQLREQCPQCHFYRNVDEEILFDR